MLDEDKIRQMTRLAVFEKEKGAWTEIASQYYKSDYISYNMIWTGIAITVAYILSIALYVFCRMEYYMNNLQTLKVKPVLITLGIIYVCVLILFEVIAFCIYSRRYKKAEKYLKEYCLELKELEKIYNKEHLRQTRATIQRNLKLEGVVSNDEFTRI